MAGYSFGTGVILGSLSRYADVKAFALFSPPVRFLEYPGVDEDARPKLFVCGDRDQSVPIASLKERVESLKQPARCQVVAGADHFWVGREEEAARHAVQFFDDTLKH
jgi:alpha/beta superfamily hydrolase